MSRSWACLWIVVLAALPSAQSLAEGYQNGLSPPGAPVSAFPPPGRPVARIVTNLWHNETSRDRGGEAERVMGLLGVNPGLAVADIGGGSGYYTVRLARRLGPAGHVFAEDVVPEYLDRLARRVADKGLTDRLTVVRGDPHDPRLPPDSVDLALLVHMYHESSSPTGCYGICARRCAPVPRSRSSMRASRPRCTARHPTCCAANLLRLAIVR